MCQNPLDNAPLARDIETQNCRNRKLHQKFHLVRCRYLAASTEEEQCPGIRHGWLPRPCGLWWIQRSGSTGAGWLSKFRKVCNRARLVSEGSSWTRAESNAAWSRRSRLFPWRSAASAWRSLAMASGRLRLQLHGFFLDQLDFVLDQLRSLFALLAVAPHSQDCALELFHPLLVLHLPLLVTGIASPVEHRQ